MQLTLGLAQKTGKRLLLSVVLLLIAAMLMIIGTLLGPETRQVELHLPDLGRGPAIAPGPGMAQHSA